MGHRYIDGRKSHIFFLIIIRRSIGRRVNQRRVNPSVYRAKRVQMLLFHLQFHRRGTACKLRYFNPKQRKIRTRIYSLHYGFKMLWIHLQRKNPQLINRLPPQKTKHDPLFLYESVGCREHIVDGIAERKPACLNDVG